VDSSEIAFRTAGRLAVSQALPECKPVLLEPVHLVTFHTPSDAMARITALIPMRRGQILQGLGELEFAFDHMAEVTGKAADKAIEARQAAAAAK
jgi:elongation factor G